jgi:hypothetical protein
MTRCDACDACSTYPRHARACTVHMQVCVTSVTAQRTPNNIRECSLFAKNVRSYRGAAA